MTMNEVLEAVRSGKLSVGEASKLMPAGNGNGGNRLSCKVSATTGALSVYGLQRMPVTLYTEQWTRLLAYADDIRAFQKANDKSLTKKADKVA